MRKISGILSVFVFVFVFPVYCQQEKSPSTFEVVEKVGSRIQQIPDGESVKNVTGTFV